MQRNTITVYSLFAALVVIATLLCGSAQAQTCTCPTSGPVPPPSGGGSSGVRPNQQVTGANGKTLLLIGQNELPEFKAYAAGVGKVPAGGSFYSNIYANALGDAMEGYLSYFHNTYPGSVVEFGLDVKGMFTFLYGDYTVTKNTAKQWQDVIAGTRFGIDTNLQMLIQKFKQYSNVTVLMRIDYEVSGNLHANVDEHDWVFTTQDPQYYKRGFCKIINMFRAAGVTNVKSVYHPVRGEHLRLYPGDDCVDWIGFSVFNHDVVLPIFDGTTYFWNNQTGIIDSNLKAGFDWAKTTGKKVMISESSVQRPYSSDPALITTYFNRLLDIVSTYNLDALTYINSNWLALGWPAEWDNSQIETKGTAMKNFWFNHVVNSTRFIQYN